MRLSRFARILIYTLLVTGAVVYSFPYIWMASSSFKVNREFMSESLEIVPQQPLPRPQSPYVDDRYFTNLEGPHQAELLPHLAALARSAGYKLPEGITADAAYPEIARGLYKKLRSLMPNAVWEKPVPEIVEQARQRIDATMVKEVFSSIHRQFKLGPVRVRDTEMHQQELGKGEPLAARFENQTPKVARLVEAAKEPPKPTPGADPANPAPPVDTAIPYAEVHYNFAEGDKVVLSRTFDLDFPVGNLYRIQLPIVPDDTWHELWVTVEMKGKRYTPRRPAVLGDFQPITLTWREPSADDQSTKVKTWVVIDEEAGAASPITGEKQLRLTLELRKVGGGKAIWNKMAKNYNEVSDQMPFWRYLRVSLFLVIANIVLTVFSSSLVAYAFARLQWPGRDLCFVILLATMMIPAQVTMIPHFLIWKNLGLYNTLTPLWLGSAFGSAFFIFMMRQFLKGIPRDLEDAAHIDGCGFLRIYWHIMLPLVKPSLAAIAIFTFMGTWNNFMGPLIYVADQRLYPLALGLYAFSIQVGAGNPTQIMAASLLMTVPVIAIFFFAQKYFIQGVTLTGMKG